ncbi:MAG: hypothetical protein M1830_006212 [Pleopsidium flavum]|nr:MAG: hypothetical protein M1830_006212 [Pleopsidium flavum]
MFPAFHSYHESKRLPTEPPKQPCSPQSATNSFEDPLPMDMDITSPFPFLTLPPELRNQIYRCALVSSKSFGVGLRFGSYDTSLFGVNRQIFSEASGIFYYENFFRIPQALFVDAPIIPQLANVYNVSRDRLMKLRRLIVELPVYGPRDEELHHKQVCANNADLAAFLSMFNGLGMEIELRLFIAWAEAGSRLDPEWYKPLLRPWTSFTRSGTTEVHLRTQGRYMDEWVDILGWM